MATMRSSSRTGRSGDNPVSRRPNAYTQTFTDTFTSTSTSSRTARTTLEPPRTGHAGYQNGRSNNASRIPHQPPSTQKQPASGSQSRPPLTHQTKSWVRTPTSGTSKPLSNTAARSIPPENSPRHVLRRKPSNLSQEMGSKRNNSRQESQRSNSSTSIPQSQASIEGPNPSYLDRALTESPMEIQVAQKAEVTTAHAVTIYPELDRYRDIKPVPVLRSDSPGSEHLPHRIATHDLPPPTPLFSGNSSLISGVSGSPSTRWSESPGPGPYSRDTTPTSMSSQSPGLIAPFRGPVPSIEHARHRSRGRAGSFSKDVTNEDSGLGAQPHPHALTAIREALTSSSSSSNSTVRDAAMKEKKREKSLPRQAPNPPPRKSSQKLTKSRDDESSPSKPRGGPSQPVTETSSSIKSPSSSQSSGLTNSRATPPVRPSREGTPDLQAQLSRVPIVQSNLSSTSLLERRTSATVSAIPRGTAPSVTQMASQPERQQRSASRAPLSREPTPAPRTGESMISPLESGRTTRTPSPSVSNFKNRFPFFGRRKTAPEVTQVGKKEKPARKGPAAGTGHEGYGRIGFHRRRSSSMSSNGIAEAMSSQGGLSNDPFLAERMAPVVISGGEVIENRNTSSELSRTESNQSSGFDRSWAGSRNDSQVSLSSRAGRTTLWPSAFPQDSSQAASIRNRRPSDISDSEAITMKSTLAFRRSVQRRASPDQAQVRIPKPINTRPARGAPSPAVTSIDTSIMSDDSMFGGRQEISQARQEEVPAGPNKLTKRARSPRKWNLFGRSQSQPAAAKKKNEPAPAAPAPTSVQVVQVKQEPKTKAFYTMIELSEPEDSEFENVQDILREAELASPPTSNQQSPSGRRPSFNRAESAPAARVLESPVKPTHRGPQRRQPEPQKPTPSTSQRTELGSPASITRTAASAPRTGRPSRLPQVGRIPKVVSLRPEVVSPKSFSRPFNRASLQILPARLDLLDTDSVAKGPTPPKSPTPDLTQEGSTLTGGTLGTNSDAQYRLSREFSPNVAGVATEFLRFSPRKGSQSTSCTTSTCSGILTFADATAVIPAPHAPLVEDEIWDEYNDFLGEELMKGPPSAGSSHGVPFYLEGLCYDGGDVKDRASLQPTSANAKVAKQNEVSEDKPPVPSSVYSTDMVEQLNDALQAVQEPSSAAIPLSEMVMSRRSVDQETLDSVKQQDLPQAGSGSSRRSRKSHTSDASGFSQLSEDTSPLSQVNLRVSSMTVSKWLSFGHVLFSPAREELVPIVGSLKRHSILVVDGLGNDDWSFYAAETYPAATFFNLSPRAPILVEQQNSSFPLSPPNHHQIQYSSYTHKFPFAPESFTTVVFRFPAAAPESDYRNIVTEARRVLKPGGYIELSILDLDLNNMGPHARRAVRRLKERVHHRAPETNLASASDLILRLMGTRGFADVKSCRVGVPVASAITRSSGSEASYDRQVRKHKEKKDERSLAEMMSDESAVADEGITKMVAKVGRWWYSRCYENGAAQLGSVSGTMWDDRQLLAECEEWRTSLKLMVCYARVPEIKRVASV